MADEVLGKNLDEYKDQEEEPKENNNNNNEPQEAQNTDNNEQTTETPNFTENDVKKEGETEEQYLDRLVGEGKKYKNVEELAKAYHNINMFVETLKREKRDIEQEYNKERERAKTIEEIMQMVQSDDEGNKQRPEDAEYSQEPASEKKAMDERSIQQKIEEALNKKEAEDKQKATYEKSINRLKEEFGSEKKAFEYVQQYIGNDDSKKKVINELGRTDPEGLVNLIRPYATREQQADNSLTSPTPGASYRVDGQQARAGLPITWSEASRLRKEKPEVYYSGDFQSKLHRAARIAEEKGVDFFNT